MLTEIYKCDKCGAEQKVVNGSGKRMDKVGIYWNPYYSTSNSHSTTVTLYDDCLKSIGMHRESKYDEQKPLDLLDILANAVADKLKGE